MLALLALQRLGKTAAAAGVHAGRRHLAEDRPVFRREDGQSRAYRMVFMEEQADVAIVFENAEPYLAEVLDPCWRSSMKNSSAEMFRLSRLRSS